MLEDRYNPEYYNKLNKNKKARVILITGTRASGKTHFICSIAKNTMNVAYLTEDFLAQNKYYELSTAKYISPKNIILTFNDLEYHLLNTKYIFVEAQFQYGFDNNFHKLFDHVIDMDILTKKDKKRLIKKYLMELK